MESRNIWKFFLNKSFSIKHYKAIRYLWFRYGLSLLIFEWYLCTVFGVGFPPLLQWSVPVPATESLSIQALSRDGIFICTSITQRLDLYLYKHYPEMGSLSVQALPKDVIFVCTSITGTQRRDLCLYKHCPEMGSLSLRALPKDGIFVCTSITQRWDPYLYIVQALPRDGIFVCKSITQRWDLYL